MTHGDVVADVYTLPDLLVRAVNRDAHADALVFPGRRTSFGELYLRAVDAARALAAQGHLRRRSRRYPDVEL